MARGPGRDGAVVVRPRRGGVLPDRRLPRDAVLLSADAGAATDLFLPAVHPELLGPPVLLHVGVVAPPALHRPAALGADIGNDVIGDAAGAVLGLRRQPE